jgi:hypothetical protein
MTRFNPRLRPVDTVIVVGLIALLAPLLPYVVAVVAPGVDHVRVGIRLAFGIALGALAARMKLFPAPMEEPRPLPPGRRVLSLLCFSIGGTFSALGGAALILVALNLSDAADIIWLGIPLAPVALGGAIIWAGVRIRRVVD